MNIHEYQAKSVLAKFGVSVPRGGVAYTPAEAEQVAQSLGGSLWVVKAQIHAGGRGKAGGVKLAKSLDEVKRLTKEMLGMILVTHQTGPEGRKSSACILRKVRTLVRSCIFPPCSTANIAASLLWAAKKAAWILRKWRIKRRKKSSPYR